MGCFRRVAKFALVAAFFAGLCGASTPAHAADDGTELLSVMTLRSDAIVFATVDSLRDVPGRDGLVEVQLKDLAPIRSRWNAKTKPLKAIRVAATVAIDNDTRSVSLGNIGKLREGGRYLLLLAGGAWRGNRGPFTRGGLSILEVRPDGYIGCDTGFVYAVTDRAFTCGQSEDYAGEPMTEAELASELIRLSAKAARQRPKLESKQAASARALKLEP